MNQEDTHPGAELSRLLIAADSCVDPHRLVGLCWELAAAEPPMPRRPVVLPPLTRPEPVGAVGAVTKLVEAAGLLLALRLLHTPAGRAKALPALREGAGR
jgi:hypothetical protein